MLGPALAALLLAASASAAPRVSGAKVEIGGLPAIPLPAPAATVPALPPPAPGLDPVDAFAALDPAEQVARSGFYAAPGALLPWSASSRRGGAFLGFYERLYHSLAASKEAAGFRVQGKPVFFLGGHDVAQIALGLPRSRPDASVNLYGRWSNSLEMLALWGKVALPGIGEVALDPESTLSLARMSQSAKVQDNVFLKWNLVALGPEGVELRGHDEQATRDLQERRLRLDPSRPLDEYALHYNLILAYRALREAEKPWTIEPESAKLIARAAETLELSQLAIALSRAAAALAKDGDRRAAMARLVSFTRRFGEAAEARLLEAAQSLPAEEGGLPPTALDRLAAPWRTARQLERLAGSSRSPQESFRFTVIGDSEPGRFWFARALFGRRGVFESLLRRADAEASDFTIQLGDMVSRGLARNFRAFFELLGRVLPRRPYLSVIGNHDRRSPHGLSDGRLYRRLFGSADYLFDHGGWRFVVLDNSSGRVTPEQLAWLDRALDAGGQRKTAVFTHMPPAALSQWTDFGPIKGAGGFREGSDEFARLVARHKVERVFVGHIHGFGTAEHLGVRYVLTGGGGSPLFPSRVRARFHHYLLVEAGPNGLSETIRR